MHFVVLVWMKWRRLCYLKRASSQMPVYPDIITCGVLKREADEQYGGGSLNCLLHLPPAADGVPLNLQPPTYRPESSLHPIRDLHGKNHVWREEVWRKEVELKRGRKGRRDTEGVEKVRDTGGGSSYCQNKKSVYTICLPDKTLEASEIRQQASL